MPNYDLERINKIIMDFEILFHRGMDYARLDSGCQATLRMFPRE